MIVANSRKLRAIYQNERKSDELDARMLAKLARVDASNLWDDCDACASIKPQPVGMREQESSVLFFVIEQR